MGKILDPNSGGLSGVIDSDCCLMAFFSLFGASYSTSCGKSSSGAVTGSDSSDRELLEKKLKRLFCLKKFRRGEILEVESVSISTEFFLVTGCDLFKRVISCVGISLQVTESEI